MNPSKNGVTGQFSAVDGLITGRENTLPTADPHHVPTTEGQRVAAHLLFSLASTWTAVGIGLVGPNAEAAGSSALPLILLPPLSSAFTSIRSMLGWIRPLVQYQPFTPAVETLRGLLPGGYGWLTVGWCLGLALLGYSWATSAFNRDGR